ncbi:MAG: TetR/AcrR family transcriptional regulator [Eubacterium sp.]|nr:TetR/AcrR family transcriptional regulator [Eubacterium sp.]
MAVKQRRTDKELIQKRAVETREKLLVSALDLYTKKGYHSSTVDEIARNAGLSTGIAYRYFKNKKELLMETLVYTFSNIKDIAGVSEGDLIGENLEQALKVFEKLHVDYKDFHEELEGLRHSDSDVKMLYNSFMDRAMKELHESLPDEIKAKPHSWENLNIAVGLMENYCHTYMDQIIDQNMNENEIEYMRKKTLEIVNDLVFN